MAKNLNMLSRSQKRELEQTGSFTTSRGETYTPNEADRANTANPATNTQAVRQQPVTQQQASQMSLGDLSRTLAPTPGPVSASDITPSQDVPLPEPQAQQVYEEFTLSAAENARLARQNLDSTLANRRSSIATEITSLEKERERLLKEGVEPNLDPFREKLEMKERERLFVEENFEANQKLVNELDTLLSEGNSLIRQAQNLPVAQRVVSARTNQAMRDVAARAGVLEAVISARNGQITQAYTMIDRRVAAVEADRRDNLLYYETLLNFNEQGLLKLEKEDQQLASKEIELLQGDFERTQATADYIKELMIDPESAQFVADAGVTLNDSVEEINAKMAAQTGRMQVEETKQAYIGAGYEYVPFPADGMEGLVQVDVNGQTLSFRVRPGSELDLELRAAEEGILASQANRSLRQQELQLSRDRFNADQAAAVSKLGSASFFNEEGELSVVDSDGNVTLVSEIDFDDPQQVDALPVEDITKAVIQGFIKTKELTPTQKAAVAEDLQAINFNPNQYILKKMNGLVESWAAVPESSRGYVEGLKFWESKTNDSVARFESQKTLLTREIARLFDVGVLSDQDVQAYKDAMPSRRDSSIEVVLNKAAGIAGAAAGTNPDNVGKTVQLGDGRSAIVGVDGNTLIDPVTGKPLE